jgi:hypothetical protein
LKKIIKILLITLATSIIIWLALVFFDIEVTNAFLNYFLKCGISVLTIEALIIVWLIMNIKNENKKVVKPSKYGLSSFLLLWFTTIWFMIFFVSPGFNTNYTDVCFYKNQDKENDYIICQSYIDWEWESWRCIRTNKKSGLFRRKSIVKKFDFKKFLKTNSSKNRPSGYYEREWKPLDSVSFESNKYKLVEQQ